MVNDQESAEANEEETPSKLPKVELEIQSDKEESSVGTNSEVGKLICPFDCFTFSFQLRTFN